MSIFRMILIGGAFFVAACEAPATYPVSGDECGPDDPVQTLDAGDCIVPGGPG